MRYLVTLTLLFLTLNLKSQETEKIVKHNTKFKKEVYYVYKSDNEIKHGEYILYIDSLVREKGYYSNGVKDSSWIKYDYDSSKIYSGKYKNGTRIGIWEFYNSEGIMVQKYDFDKNELIFNDKEKVKNTSNIKGGDFDSLIYVDEWPSYKDGIGGLYLFITKNIKYPVEARNNSVSGKVYISATINKNGEFTEIKVIKGLGYGCDEEALRVFNLTIDNWNPATFNNQLIDFQMIFPLGFTLK